MTKELSIRGQITKYGTKTLNTIPVALNLIDETFFKNTILSTPNSGIEYDILVWNDNDVLLFEKKGKTSREKLEETLSFNVELDIKTYVHLDLTVIINGKKYPFLTLSPNNHLLDDIKNLSTKEVKFNYNPSFTVTTESLRKIGELGGVLSLVGENNEAISSDLTQDTMTQLKHQQDEYAADGHWDIFLPMMTQDDINQYISKTIGKLSLDLPTEMDNIYSTTLDAKIKLKFLELDKKQTLSSIYKTESESNILDNMVNEELYVNLMNLLKSYELNGLENLSDYRLKVYENLKLAVDNLIKLKGRLENI